MIRSNLEVKGLDYTNFDILYQFAGGASSGTFSGAVVGATYMIVSCNNISAYTGCDMLSQDQGSSDKFSIVKATATTMTFNFSGAGSGSKYVILIDPA